MKHLKNQQGYQHNDHLSVIHAPKRGVHLEPLSSTDLICSAGSTSEKFFKSEKQVALFIRDRDSRVKSANS